MNYTALLKSAAKFLLYLFVDVVDELKTMLAQTPPELREPSPHEVIDIIGCVELLEMGWM